MYLLLCVSVCVSTCVKTQVSSSACACVRVCVSLSVCPPACTKRASVLCEAELELLAVNGPCSDVYLCHCDASASRP